MADNGTQIKKCFAKWLRRSDQLIIWAKTSVKNQKKKKKKSPLTTLGNLHSEIEVLGTTHSSATPKQHSKQTSLLSSVR